MNVPSTPSHVLAPALASCALCLGVLGLAGCPTGSETFVGNRLPDLCNEAYYTCGVTAGCSLDEEHYVRGVFPGARRVVLITEQDDALFQVRIYLTEMEAPGTELLVQLYEPDCSLDIVDGRAHLEDIDLFDEAGPDRTLDFELVAASRGEHLLEIFSDASAGFLLVVEPR